MCAIHTNPEKPVHVDKNWGFTSNVMNKNALQTIWIIEYSDRAAQEVRPTYVYATQICAKNRFTVPLLAKIICNLNELGNK